MLSRLLIVPVKLYQWCISPLFPASCRFQPSCSAYMVGALKQHGVKGLWLGTKRLLRCHPWGGEGYDPVPSKFRFFGTVTPSENTSLQPGESAVCPHHSHK